LPDEFLKMLRGIHNPSAEVCAFHTPAPIGKPAANGLQPLAQMLPAPPINQRISSHRFAASAKHSASNDIKTTTSGTTQKPLMPMTGTIPYYAPKLTNTDNLEIYTSQQHGCFKR